VKRFWQEARVEARSDGFAITLDGKSVRTPGKRSLVVPSRALAEAIAGEWNAQGESVEPGEMPLTRYANSASDGVVLGRSDVIEEVTRYGATDLVCYRAADPPELVERQSDAWQPLVDWIAGELGIRLEVVTGVIPVAQPAATIEGFRAAVTDFEDFPLTGLHGATAACGSLVVALALARGRLDAEAAWALSSIDETFQIERWGEDREAVDRQIRLRAEIEAASRFMKLGGAR
jgi:chaperone required for assembly of F1-ATPase